MNLVSIAISVCWLLIGLIILCGIVYIALHVAKTFLPVPQKVEQAIWLVVLLLVLIAALTLVAGGSIHNFRIGTADRAVGPAHMHGLLRG